MTLSLILDKDKEKLRMTHYEAVMEHTEKLAMKCCVTAVRSATFWVKVLEKPYPAMYGRRQKHQNIERENHHLSEIKNGKDKKILTK